MIRNELTNTAVDSNNTTSAATETTLTGEQKQALVTAMKIAYYRDFYKRGIITADQLEQLLAMQKEYIADDNKPAA
ncbi:MAG: hypothetical protein IJ784_15105 [Ruminiclostridium sp.]|uniref:hypothetical protein n=1 Tax=Ruminococcus sp. TaxID=41978 RepID=UPI0025F92759|nr:hypothetical protein [Ruminococcus sp.]MBR1432438.1 hypothetical protein [Ruminococcus sp.]MBR1833732.1 hypothetical protein [Ruminiclostridium sp.]